MFQELGSHPPTMEAGRSCDAYGLFEAQSIEQADAKRAYTQAYLTNPRRDLHICLAPREPVAQTLDWEVQETHVQVSERSVWSPGIRGAMGATL